MADQTITTAVNYDSASISGLADGEALSINGGAVTIDADVRWNQQAAVFGNITLSSSLGGSLIIDGTKVWEVPFSASTGNVPTQAALGSNGVTGGTSGATGELTRVWATGSLTPATAGTAMPATGFIKLRSRTGNFQTGETITLPGGATVTASSAGRRSWINVVGREGRNVTIPRLGSLSVTGDWYDLGTTSGADDQTIQFPVADECPALQIETAAGSGIYEWWLNAGRRWVGHVQFPGQTVSGMTATTDATPRPPTTDAVGFISTGTTLKETATTAVHQTSVGIPANSVDTGIYTVRTYVRKDTRRWCYVGAFTNGGVDRYGVLVDFDASGAVVATPTVGSPTNTAHTVTAVGGGWYLVTVQISHAVFGSLMGGVIAASNSATPTYSGGVPSYAGSTTEGVTYSELQIVAPASTQYVESADERGKYFFSNPQTGVITFSQRTGRTAGVLPASGCKIRVPNLIMSSASPADFATNNQATTISNRTGLLTTAGGALSISTATWNWNLSATSPFSVSVANVAAATLSFSTVASTVSITNCGVGLSRDANPGTAISVASSPSGTTISDTRFCGIGQISICSAATLTRCRGEQFGLQGSVLRASSANAYNIVNSSNVTLTDCVAIGGTATIATCVGVTVSSLVYAERIIGQTTNLNSTGATAIIVSTSCTNIRVNGFANVPGLTNVHPFFAIVNVTTNCNGVDIRNIGTAAAPYNCGSANQTGVIVSIASTCFNIALRRLYAINTRTATISSVNSSQGVRLYNVWGDAADSQSHAAIDMICQGCRWSNASSVQSAVYGLHWEDAYTGTTSGRLTISGNEPLTGTVDQCAATFGQNAGFTSGGSIAMPNLTDAVTWTMPYYAIGHVGIAQYTYGASATETWTLTGTNAQNFELDYAIDTGGGFGAWKFLLDIARQSSGGASGTNTITLTAADVTAMTRKPTVGDLIQTANGRIPAGTTITGVSGASGNVLTLSSNFASAVGGSELVYVWKDIASEVISPTTGYRLRVRARVNTAASGNLFSFLRIPFDTTATAQQAQYPLPGSSLTVNGLVANSRVKVARVDTGATLSQNSTAGTSLTFDLPYEGAVRVEARNASGSPAYRPWASIATVSNSSPVTITALQEAD